MFPTQKFEECYIAILSYFCQLCFLQTDLWKQYQDNSAPKQANLYKAQFECLQMDCTLNYRNSYTRQGHHAVCLGV